MSPHGVHLLLGEDRPRKLQRIQELERSLGIQPLDRHHVDAAATTSAQLLALCRQRPATSPVRLIVVDQAHRLDKGGVEALLEHAEVIAKSACLVLLVETEVSLRHPLAQVLHRAGGGQAGEGMAIERFPGRQTLAAKPFAFTDALGSRNVAGALTALHDQLAAGKEPLELLGLVAWQLQRWVAVRRLRDAGCGAERIAGVTGLKAWQVQRAQSEIARRPLESLQRLLARCWELDVDAKSGRTVAGLAIEQLVLEICQDDYLV